MLNYTKTAKTGELLLDIANLPDKTDSVDEALGKLVKETAVSLILNVKENGAYLHIRAHSVPELKAQQVEVHVTGREIKDVSPL